MTIVTTRVGLVIDTLIASMNASPTFAPPNAVFDGPDTTSDSSNVGTSYTSAVFIGFDGDWHQNGDGEVTNPSYEAVEINQRRPYVGDTTVFEELEIRCVAESWSGQSNLQTARNSTLTMLNGVETIIRTDPTLGIDGSTIATLQTGSLFYRYDSDGNLAAWIPFVIHIQTTLLTH